MGAQHLAEAATVDWNVIAGAVATFIVTAFLAIKGWNKGKDKVLEDRASVAGGMITDNLTMRENAIAQERLADQLHDHCEALRANTAALTRHTDIMVLTARNSG